MFNILKKKSEKVNWDNCKQQEEIMNGELIITIHGKTMIEDLNVSISNFMRNNGTDFKYKVVISKIEED